MAELSAEARIRDLKRRLELDPSSRLFVTLAEEYRKIGRLPEALSTLQKGLLAHPGYLSAHVALGRAYLEAGQITESIATFTKVLAADPGNLVSAKSLADIYLSRGESVEAIKKYKLYRALSGDKSVDDIIERLSVELAPPPPPRPEPPSMLPPPPTFFDGKPAGPIRTSREIQFKERPKRPRPETLEMSALSFELDDSTMSRKRDEEPYPVLSRDNIAPRRASVAPPLPQPEPSPAGVAAQVPEEREREAEPVAAAAPAVMASAGDLSTRALRVADVLVSAPPEEPVPPPPAGLATEPPAPPSLFQEAPDAGADGDGESETGAEPRGRTLADLYYAQGHFPEALRIYDDLVAANPFDAELIRLRRDAEARLLPAASARGGGDSDADLKRRLARVRALKRWLAVVQTG